MRPSEHFIRSVLAVTASLATAGAMASEPQPAADEPEQVAVVDGGQVQQAPLAPLDLNLKTWKPYFGDKYFTRYRDDLEKPSIHFGSDDKTARIIADKTCRATDYSLIKNWYHVGDRLILPANVHPLYPNGVKYNEKSVGLIQTAHCPTVMRPFQNPWVAYIKQNSVLRETWIAGFRNDIYENDHVKLSFRWGVAAKGYSSPKPALAPEIEGKGKWFGFGKVDGVEIRPYVNFIMGPKAFERLTFKKPSSDLYGVAVYGIKASIPFDLK